MSCTRDLNNIQMSFTSILKRTGVLMFNIRLSKTLFSIEDDTFIWDIICNLLMIFIVMSRVPHNSTEIVLRILLLSLSHKRDNYDFFLSYPLYLPFSMASSCALSLILANIDLSFLLFNISTQ